MCATCRATFSNIHDCKRHMTLVHRKRRLSPPARTHAQYDDVPDDVMMEMSSSDAQSPFSSYSQTQDGAIDLSGSDVIRSYFCQKRWFFALFKPYLVIWKKGFKVIFFFFAMPISTSCDETISYKLLFCDSTVNYQFFYVGEKSFVNNLANWESFVLFFHRI